MNLKWFISGRVRRALSMHKHVWKILSHQRDILTDKAVAEVELALGELKTAAAQTTEKAALQKQMDNLEAVANKWLKPYPKAAIRENVEMLLVALAVAMGIRTFFLQPFKIPTGSMQPTLFGVNSVNSRQQPDIQIPTGLARFKEFLQGNSYLHVVADEDGEFNGADSPFRFLIFSIKQTYYFNRKPHTIWFPPDYGSDTLMSRGQIQSGQRFRKGEDIVKMRIQSGDYLFVNRMTYNFRPPVRGDIVVFETKGIPEERRNNPPYWQIPDDQFYIKRLVGLGDEQIQIGDDRHLIINGHRLDSSTPHFENVYSFDPNQPPRQSQYSGHVNFPQLTPFFQGKPDGFLIPKDNYMVMGDNTMNSLDSRSWGSFPAESVIGKSSFVYWPLTKRWGWGNR